jgi:hypothetical protein
VRALGQAGVISDYRMNIDPARVGLNFSAIIFATLRSTLVMKSIFQNRPLPDRRDQAKPFHLQHQMSLPIGLTSDILILGAYLLCRWMFSWPWKCAQLSRAYPCIIG